MLKHDGGVTWKGREARVEMAWLEFEKLMVCCVGFALLKGRKVVFTADDFSIRAGHADGAMAEKTVCISPFFRSLPPSTRN